MTTDRYDPSNYDTESVKLIEELLKEAISEFNNAYYLEAKDIMNKYFGEENNQISRPATKDAIRTLSNSGYGMDFDLLRLHDRERMKVVISKCYVYIRFPEIKITNSGTGNKGHIIKDLWVRFTVNKDFGVSDFRGVRSYLTLPEAKAGYFHSHLPSYKPTKRDPPQFNSFCQGTGPINQVINVLHINGYDKINFTLFCLHIKNYVVWESIEGTPHIRYARVSEQSNTLMSEETEISAMSLPTLGEYSTEKAVEILKNKLSDLSNDEIKNMLDVVITNDEVKVNPSIELEMKLGHWIQLFTDNDVSNVSMRRITMLCYKDSNGTYISLDDRERERNSVRLIEPAAPIFEFKGQPVYLKIEGLAALNNLPNAQNNTENVYAHPTITAEFCKSFTRDFSDVCFRFEKVIKENSVENFLKVTGSNLLPMQQGS